MKTTAKLIAQRSHQHSGMTKTGKRQLLIVSDSSERVSKLRAALNLGEIEITTVNSPGLSQSLHRDYDLAVVDVGLEQIAGILKTLRSKTEYAAMPVLVECGGISTEPGFAGLLPQYRAMPCFQPDLIALVKNRLAPAASNQRKRGIL